MKKNICTHIYTYMISLVLVWFGFMAFHSMLLNGKSILII